MELLTVSNPKVMKGQKKGYLTAILHLAPSTMSGYNVCPLASRGCKDACLNTAGRGGMFSGEVTKDLAGGDMVKMIKSGRLHNVIQSARIRKTHEFFENRDKFLATLEKEIGIVIKRAAQKNLIPAIRLNGTSDIRWENTGIIQKFPDIQFYDYTALPNRRNLPANYHLTFSRKEDNDVNVKIAIENGMNVAVVFDKVPATWNGLPVINGDETDLRFLDPKNVIVGLKAKGKGKKDTSGFVIISK